MDLSEQKRLQSDLMMANLNLENLIEKEIAERIKSEQKYAHFFNSATDAIFIHGFDKNNMPSNFIDVNAQSLKLLGYTREELLNLSPIDLNVDNHRVISNAKTLHENENLITETLLKTKDGTIINVELNSKLFHLDNTLLAFTTVRNITEKKRLEKARKEHEQLLIQQSKMAAMGEMIGAIAHQWRQPLNALAIMVQDLEDAFEFGELSKEYIDTKVSKAMSQINFMSKTIDDFRNFFKPNRAKVEFNPIKAINELLELISEQFKRHDIKININEFEQKVLVFGFVNEFKQVILNILNNAKDAILEHSNSGAIDVYFEINENKFLIHIKDSGGGIPEAIIDRIFEPYFTTKSDDKGTGVGLYMSNIIIEKNMGGKLKVCNGEKGAIFTIELPLNC